MVCPSRFVGRFGKDGLIGRIHEVAEYRSIDLLEHLGDVTLIATLNPDNARSKRLRKAEAAAQ